MCKKQFLVLLEATLSIKQLCNPPTCWCNVFKNHGLQTGTPGQCKLPCTTYKYLPLLPSTVAETIFVNGNLGLITPLEK